MNTRDGDGMRIGYPTIMTANNGTKSVRSRTGECRGGGGAVATARAGSRLAGALLVALAVASGAPGQSQLREVRLECGLRVVVYEDARVPEVSVQLWYLVGAAQESPGQAGTVAALVHALSRAGVEEHDPAGAARAAAVVRRDACAVIESGASGEWRGLLARQFHRLRAALGSELLPVGRAPDTGRADIPGHLPDEPGCTTWQNLLRAAFPGDHPYGRPIILQAGALDAELLQDFRRNWFVPAGAVLVVYGAVQADEVVAATREQAAGLPWREAPARAAFEPPPSERVELEAPRTGDDPAAHDADLRGVDLAWVIPGQGDYSIAALDGLLHLLCSPVAGRLARRLQSEGEPPPRWRRWSWKHAGLLVLSLDGPPAAAVAQVLEKLAAVEAGGVGPEELNRARTRARFDRLQHRALFTPRAWTYGEAEAVAGDVFLAELEIPRLRRIRVSDLQDAAARLRAARTLIRPRGHENWLSAAPRCTFEELWRAGVAQGGVRQIMDGLRGSRQTLAADGHELAAVRWRWETGGATLPLLWHCGYEALGPRELADLLEYRGVELHVFDDGVHVGLEGVCVPEELPLLMELASGWPRSARPPVAAAWRSQFCAEEELREWSPWFAEVVTAPR